MTHKRILWIGHPAKRLHQREFTREQVRHVLAVGIHSKELTLRGAQRYGKRAYLANHRELKVIYMEDATTIRIVTVMWTDEDREDWADV